MKHTESQWQTWWEYDPRSFCLSLRDVASAWAIFLVAVLVVVLT